MGLGMYLAEEEKRQECLRSTDFKPILMAKYLQPYTKQMERLDGVDAGINHDAARAAVAEFSRVHRISPAITFGVQQRLASADLSDFLALASWVGILEYLDRLAEDFGDREDLEESLVGHTEVFVSVHPGPQLSASTDDPLVCI
ncbi:MAG: hypothetical protein ACYCRD_04735 [Leptospirillum sp.]